MTVKENEKKRKEKMTKKHKKAQTKNEIKQSSDGKLVMPSYDV